MAKNTDNTLWGIKIWDSTGIYYYTEVNVSQDLTHNVPTETTVGYNAKFPFVTHNGIAFYYSGSCSGNFSENTQECEDDYNFDYRIDDDGNYIYDVKYMNGFVKWLNNKRMKYLQLSEQLVIPCNIQGEIKWSTETSIDDGYNCTISFDWVQADEDFSLDETTLNKFCPSCGHVVAPTAYFCQSCGYRIRDEEGYVYTGCYDSDGEIKFKGTLYNDISALNTRLASLDVDTTNLNYSTVGFSHSIVVFNSNSNSVNVISVGLSPIWDRYNRRIWIDNAVAKSTITNNESYNSSNVDLGTLQWEKFEEPSATTSPYLVSYLTMNSTAGGVYRSNTLSFNARGNKYIILNEKWTPFSMR